MTEVYTDDIWYLFLCTLLEQNIGIIAACLVTFRPLFRVLGIGSRNPRDNGSDRIGVQGYSRPSKMKANRSGYDTIIELQTSALRTDLKDNNHYKSAATVGPKSQSLDAQGHRNGMKLDNGATELGTSGGLSTKTGILYTKTFDVSSREP